MHRESALARLRAGSEVFDLLIVGGGASGLGAAVDAAARGYRVALIEQGDFAQGTSSRSTKLVHGGVRYLGQGNVALVKSALRERGRLLRNAPHLAHAMPFVIPSYTWWEKPYYAFGLTLYDLLAGRLSLGASQRLSRAETIRHLPTIEAEGLRGGVLYYDGQFDDARLAINLAQTAVEGGAVLVNYCACVGLVKEQGVVGGVLARDVETGAEFTVRARAVINATGVFVDALRRFDEPKTAPMVAVSQGVHVVLPREFLPGSSALMIPKTADGRVLFAIPWHARLVVGTTDTPEAATTMAPRALPEEVAFIMGQARKYLAKDPRESDVLSVFAGLRPLVKRGKGVDTARLSRDHTIAISRSRLITLTGGKWTTYRKMAEDVVDQAERIAGLGHTPSPTAERAIHGAAATGTTTGALHRYGSDAAAIAGLASSDPALNVPVHPDCAVLRAEVVWHARHEMARTVEDVLARRTRTLVLGARASIEAAPAVARLLADELGRDERWVAMQVQGYGELARGWMLSPSPEPAQSWCTPLVA
ncbi:MAG: glycerol-3-phosphate dehydrogenase/oxidase [Opitutus sp.]|nr:glycerol-3-phosphate dehydrogenase/oxidase [Opitutus sp.]